MFPAELQHPQTGVPAPELLAENRHVLDRPARAVQHGHHHRLAVGDVLTTG
jgi:hypothetical protein